MVYESILLVGAGGHARSCIDVIEQEGRYKIAGLIGLPSEVGQEVLGYSIIGDDEDLPALLTTDMAVLITLGQIKTAALRVKMYEKLQKMCGNFPVIISPRAYVSPHAKINNGTIVMHGAIINAGADIGHNCIINSNVLIEHDVVVSDHCHISTASVLNGAVIVDRETFVGSGAHVRQSIKIGKRCIIGMGQSVVKNCLDDCKLFLVKG